MRIQPDEGISLSFACKRPGMQLQLDEVRMDFVYGEAFHARSPEAYERLLLDALRGDASLFTRSDEVEYAWRFITSILDGWAAPAAAARSRTTIRSPTDRRRRSACWTGLTARWRPMGGGADC